MSPDDGVLDVDAEHPDGLSPEQLRRFQLWRAMSSLAQAQAGGALTGEQVRLIESLAENLQQLAGQLRQLAELGQQCAELLDPGRTPVAPGESQAVE